MKFHIFSYRYAHEILEHHTNTDALGEIIDVVSRSQLFIYPGKSQKNKRLDVVQQCMNTWFDRSLAVEYGWLYHPLATRIRQSRLAADFRKAFPNITIQAEVQFGNMSRWYSDIFKLQTAYSQSLIDLGLSIVPMGVLGRRIDSNIASYERVLRELPSANLSITLPILVIGVEPDEDTQVVDLRVPRIPLSKLIRKGSEKNRYRIIHALAEGRALHEVDEASDTGPMANPIVDVPDEDEE